VLIGDPTRLRQLLFNLIGNALKFTENGQVEINVKQIGERNDNKELSLLFEVVDDGIGISDELKPKLFDSFTQADTSINRRFGGSGLGLTICRYITDAMGGEINVESREGEGSKFWFNLSFPYSLKIEGHIDESCCDEGNKVTGLDILLVEDDLINQRAESALLQQNGHKVTVASDGYSALRILSGNQEDSKETFDLILMDIHMPGMNGMEATQHVRNMPGPISDLPVIALTADVTQQNINKCLAAGMDRVLSKPIRHEELSRLLCSVQARSSVSANPMEEVQV